MGRFPGQLGHWQVTCVQTQTFNEPTCVSFPTVHKVVSAPNVPIHHLSALHSHLAWTGANVEALLVVGVLLVALGITIIRFHKTDNLGG